MSKEQTPIKPEEFLTGKASQIRLGVSQYDSLLKCMEQYANAKVLEALEREFTGLLIMKPSGDFSGGKPYFETQVKPKYI